MPNFLYVFRGGALSSGALSPSEMQQHLVKWRTWIEALAKQGHHLGGHAVQRNGKSLRGQQRTLSDGPYAESKDLVTGNLVISAASLDAAVALALECPIFEMDGSVEVRPIIDDVV